MKILYIAPVMADYQSDALFHGLRSLLGHDIVDIPKLEHLYVGGPVPPYGRGFTMFNLLPDLKVDRSPPRARIVSGEFDLVIVAGDHLYSAQPLPFQEALRRYLPPGRLMMVDGSDNSDIAQPDRIGWGVYFKRENVGIATPISFAIPEEKLACGVWPRRLRIAEYEPGMPYRFDHESDYYAGYQEAAFAHTRMKAGWDSLRHYEIMATGCIPIFKDIERMPPETCFTLPKKALQKVMDDRGWESMSDEQIAAVGSQFFEWCRNQCTTEVLASYVLSHAPRTLTAIA